MEIPFPYTMERVDEIGRKGISASDLARHFPTPRLSLVGDEVADGEWEAPEGEPRPLALFDAVRVDYSLRRLVHYTGCDWRWVQHWILLTNYHRYVDQFIRWGLARLAEPGTPYERLVLPGDLEIRRGDLSQRCGGNYCRELPGTSSRCQPIILTAPDGEGVTLVNIGVGPPNAKNITDHLAVLRPNCWLMVGHCGGLRQSQQIGDYVLAHAYLRQDRILDSLVPPEVPIPALAEVQVALQDAAAIVTGEQGDRLEGAVEDGHGRHQRRSELGAALTRRSGGGSIFRAPLRSTWKAAPSLPMDIASAYPTALFSASRTSRSTARSNCRVRPTHFTRQRWRSIWKIGLKALELLRGTVEETLHSRKLRSFDEPPFR